VTAVELPERTRAYLTHPALSPLWTRVREKLERGRLTVAGTVTVDLDDDGATRLQGLLGRRVRAGAVRVKLDVLDEALRRSAAAAGLVAVLTELSGPLTDRTAVREHREATWAEVFTALDAALADAGLAHAAWVPPFVDGLTRVGLLTRAGVPTAQDAVRAAAATLAELADGTLLAGDDDLVEPRWELAGLAGAATGNSHGLDDGTLTGSLVLRAVAAAAGEPVPRTAAERRALWELVGVTPDQVSGTALAWGLRPPGASRWAAMMRDRAELGLVSHLTLYELRAFPDEPLAAPGQRVFACENPQVLQAAARAAVPAPLVCFAGNPASAGLLLLARLVRDRAEVAYHGDFDWPGMRIAGRLLHRGAGPWRMSAADYAEAVGALPAGARLGLSGTPARTPWDPELATAMRRRGLAVHEESLLPSLLADLV
jgi:uncharacterized protein (TIGR02679 family)